MLIEKFNQLNNFHKLRFILGVLHLISALILIVIIIHAIIRAQNNLLISTSIIIGGVIVNQIFYHIYRMLGFLEKMLNKEKKPKLDDDV